ncbi:MAG: ABC transporter permease, partial [Spirochaetota bacterium]
LKSRYAYFSGTVLASSVVNLVFFVPIFVLLSIYAKADSCTMIMILCVCALGITASMGIGVMISLMAMLWKQVQALAAILALLFEFLSGAYAPIHLYPAPVKALAYVLPYTWGYDLVRYYLFKGEYQPLLPVVYEWLLFAGLAAVYTVISLILLKVVEHRVRTRGLGLL